MDGVGVNYLFYLDELEVEEPFGFGDLELSIDRDKLHGISFEASLNQLRFYGAGADYLIARKEAEGIRANVIFEAFEACDGYDYTSLIRGRLNFGRFRSRCGDTCWVSMPIEQESCEVILNARYDQKVDLDKTTAADGITALANYAGLGMSFELPAREIDARVEGYSDATDINDIPVIDEPDVDGFGLNVRPTYTDERFDSINNGQLIPASNYTQNSLLFTNAISPQLLFDDVSSCFAGNFEYTFRFKGRFSLNTNADGFNAVARIETWDGEGDSIFNDSDLLQSSSILSGAYVSGTVVEFDVTLSSNIALVEGLGLYGLIQFSAFSSSPQDFTVHVEFDPETYVLISNVKSCPPTETEGYLIHEALSRVTESITNNCMRVKSSLYGRTDSQPFEFSTDGCGGPRFVTSGLKIRNAPDGKFFASLKDLIEGLNAIDNIGVGVEPDTLGRFVLRVEDVAYFYQDIEILQMPAIPNAEEEVIESEHYSRIEVGYEKWEVQRVNGLDEINSNREYVTVLDTLNNTLPIKSKLVTGSYAIESTRQQSLAGTGNADTSYDNETFLITLYRGGYLYSELFVDQGNITNAANIFSPQTLYNYTLSPLRNLMRWWGIIQAGAPGKLSFSAGTGNLQATGEQSSDFCKLESMPLIESQNLNSGQFISPPTPIYRPENVIFEYPLSIADYQLIKANPYGYISYQCGNGEWAKGYIKNIKYRQSKGMATVTLRKKWQS